LVGKYVELQDSYKSILESFIHAGAANETKVNVVSIHSEHIDANSAARMFEGIDGILVAPGFGERGIEGKIATVRYARENNIPFFGICLGMQMAVIEYARTVLGLADANSTEMNPDTKNPVIDLMESQKTITDKGGTMRLGSWKCNIKEGTLAHQIYGKTQIEERHRHRYEYNNTYATQLESAGLISSGINPDTGLVEIIELKNHPFFIGVQYHPEYKSTVANPQPIFVSFVAAIVKEKLARDLKTA
jgi:CTP synthase